MLYIECDFGAENMIMNMYRNIDRNNIQLDFSVHSTEPGDFEREIKLLGGVYRVQKYMFKNFFSYVEELNQFFERNLNYDIVHGHMGSAAAIYLSIAKKHGAVTIAHSHSANSTQKDFRNIAWRLCSYPTRYIADYFIGCAPEAAIHRFGKQVVGSDRCWILFNGIDCDRFALCKESRHALRKEYCLEDRFVVGHVGRRTKQKKSFFHVGCFC